MEQTKPSAEGLRYRKKLKARLSVERAALELVIERGYDGVTVEDICARAEISKKTFFNYFPSKAAAIMGRLDSFPDDEQLVRILEEHSEACYLDVLVGVVGTGAASGVDAKRCAPCLSCSFKVSATYWLFSAPWPTLCARI